MGNSMMAHPHKQISVRKALTKNLIQNFNYGQSSKNGERKKIDSMLR